MTKPTQLSQVDLDLLEKGIYLQFRPPPELRAKLEMQVALLKASAQERGQEMIISSDGERLISRFIGKRSHTVREVPFCRLEDFLPKRFRTRKL